MLLVPGKCARGRIAESRLHGDVRLRQRLSRHAAECFSARGGPGRVDRCQRGERDLPRGVFFSSPRPDDTAHEAGRSAAGRRSVDAAAPGIGRLAVGEARANFRESRRADGREQSASARPDLGERRSAEHPSERASGDARVFGGESEMFVVRILDGWKSKMASALFARTRVLWLSCLTGRSGRSKR